MVKRYEIRTKIGQGGLGDVFVAYDNHLDREVALKRMRPTRQEEDAAEGDLLREAKTLSTLQHPNIVTLYDIGTDEDGVFAVMELIRGETLDVTVERGALTLDDFRNVVRQTLEGMIAAHAAGLLHRDVKPSNLMVNWLPSGKFQIKILDFGLAKFSQHPAEQTSDQGDGILGSIYFMAPEQFERLPLDPRTDIYSLGCVYYYTLTQRHPFEGESPAQVMASHLRHDVEPLAKLRPDLPQEVCSWVMWLINRAPADRPANAQEAYDYFREANAGEAPPLSATAKVRPVLVAPTSTAGTGSSPMQAPLRPATASTRNLAPAIPPPTPGSEPGAQVIGGGSAPSAVLTRAAPVNRPAPPPGSFPRWALVTLPLCLVAAALATLIVIQRGRAEELRQKKFAGMQRQDHPQGDTETVGWLTDYLEAEGEIGVSAAIVLAKLKGPGVAEEMVQLLPSLDGNAQVNMIRALGMRRHEGALALVELATTSASPTVRLEALVALAEVATERDLQPLIQSLPGIRGEQEKAAAQAAILTILDRRTNDAQRTGQLVREFSETDDLALKEQLLHMLSHLGGKNALGAVTAALEDPEEQVRTAALRSLSAWPTSEPAETLLQVARSSDSVILKAVALLGYVDLAASAGDRPVSARVEMIKTALDLAQAGGVPKVHRRVFESLQVLPDPAAKEVAKSFEADTALGGQVQAVLGRIDRGIARKVELGGRGGELQAKSAQIVGDDAEYQSRDGGVIGRWDRLETSLVWTFSIPESGTYNLSVEQAASGTMGGRFQVGTGGATRQASVMVTGDTSTFEIIETGEVTYDEPGVYQLVIQPLELSGEELMVLRSVSLERQSP